MIQKRNYFTSFQYCSKALAFLCGITFLFPAITFAQADTSRKLKEVKILNKPIPQVQTLTPSQQIASSDFKRYSAFNIADALRNFSGVNIKDYGGIGGLKTISVRSLGANNTAVLYDGIQISDAQNGQIDLGKYSLENVQQITLYNSQPDDLLQTARAFASASVIVINPLTPKFTASKPYNLQLGFKTGSFGLINPSLLWQQKISQRWYINANANWQKANGEYKYKDTQDGSDTLATRRNSDINSIQTEAAIFYHDADSTNFNLRVNYYGSQRGLPGAVIAYNSNTRQRLWNQDIFIQSRFSKNWVNGLRLLLNGKASRSYLRYVDPDYLNDIHLEDDRYTQREVYGSAALSYQVTNALNVAYSSDLAVADLTTSQYGYAYPVRTTWLNVLAANYKLGRFNLMGNLLNTHISETISTGTTSPSRSVYSPTIMLTVTPFDISGLQFRAFYKDIFRNPTFNDLYYTRIGNRNLRPEYTKQFDLGSTFVKAYNNGLLEYITLTFDGYYNKVTDKIIATPTKDLFTWSVQNVGRVDIWGVDAGLKSQLHLSTDYKGVLSVNYTYQSALDVTDPSSSVYRNQIPYTPKNTLAFNTGVFNQHFGLFYNQIYSSSRYYLSQNIPANYVPGFFVSDASATYKLSLFKQQAMLSAEVNNLFNTPYALIRSFPMPGRSYRLSIQFTI